MAEFKPYFEVLMKHEGGFVKNPKDKGGATKFGVTFNVWLKNGHDKDGDGDIDEDDLKKITKEDAYPIAKKRYWDIIKGDKIDNQSIAEFIFDWAYNSGTKSVVSRVQQVLGLQRDGIMGERTLAAINTLPQKQLFEKLKHRREVFYKGIAIANPSQMVFLKGWLKRNDSFKFRENAL